MTADGSPRVVSGPRHTFSAQGSRAVVVREHIRALENMPQRCAMCLLPVPAAGESKP